MLGLQTLVQRECLVLDAIVLDDDNLEVLVGRLLPDGVEAALEHEGLILVGNDDGDKRFLLGQVIHDAMHVAAEAIDHIDGDADTLVVIPDRNLAGLVRVGLGVGVAGSRMLMGAPMIEHLAHMEDVARLLRNLQGHIPVLRTRDLIARKLDGIHDGLAYREQMAHVIAGSEQLPAEIRLEEAIEELAVPDLGPRRNRANPSPDND